jgi:hypothetical protein
MPLPEHTINGNLPPGIHCATLREVIARYGHSSLRRGEQANLLQSITEAALDYPTMKRVLVWGSFVTAKMEPNDLDYSLVVSITHAQTQIIESHRRFFVPVFARMHYGADTGYLLLRDYPLEPYLAQMDFICQNRRIERGIIEISLRGEKGENEP